MTHKLVRNMTTAGYKRESPDSWWLFGELLEDVLLSPAISETHPKNTGPNGVQRHSRQLIAVKNRVGLVNGFRCSECLWSVSFGDPHTSWAIPVCYIRPIVGGFKNHECARLRHQVLALTGCPAGSSANPNFQAETSHHF